MINLTYIKLIRDTLAYNEVNKGKEGENMSKHLTLNEGIKGNLKRLELYVPVVARVHGGHHPEFHEVRKLYDEIVRKLGEGSEKPDLSEEFGKIRVITDNYTVPGDVCESYEAVYNMLAELEEAFKEVV